MLCGPCHSSFTVDINIACQNPWTCMPFDWAPLGNHQNNQKVILGCYCILFIWLCGFWCRWKCNFKKNREVGAFSSLKLTRVSKTSVPFVKELWYLCYVKHQQSKCPTIPMLVDTGQSQAVSLLLHTVFTLAQSKLFTPLFCVLPIVHATAEDHFMLKSNWHFFKV